MEIEREFEQNENAELIGMIQQVIEDVQSSKVTQKEGLDSLRADLKHFIDDQKKWRTSLMNELKNELKPKKRNELSIN